MGPVLSVIPSLPDWRLRHALLHGLALTAAFLIGTLPTNSALAQGNLLRKMTTKIEADPGKVYALHKQHGRG